jgi:anti-sigma-K factor RskA
MNCEQVDELGAAYALDAIEADERRAIDAHLDSCREPHAEARSALPALLAAGSVESVLPRPELRARLMTTVAATPQRTTAAPPRRAAIEPAPPRRSWLDRIGLLRPVAMGAVAASLVLAVVAGTLWAQLQDRDAELRAVAEALRGSGIAHAVSGTAASGYLVDTPDGTATLVVSGLPELPEGQLYELWLMDAKGNPVIAGTHTGSADELKIIELEEDPAGWATFAITVERSRVGAPTTDPVLIGELSG